MEKTFKIDILEGYRSKIRKDLTFELLIGKHIHTRVLSRSPSPPDKIWSIPHRTPCISCSNPIFTIMYTVWTKPMFKICFRETKIFAFFTKEKWINLWIRPYRFRIVKICEVEKLKAETKMYNRNAERIEDEKKKRK